MACAGQARCPSVGGSTAGPTHPYRRRGPAAAQRAAVPAPSALVARSDWERISIRPRRNRFGRGRNPGRPGGRGASMPHEQLPSHPHRTPVALGHLHLLRRPLGGRGRGRAAGPGGIVLRLDAEELHEKGCLYRAFARELGFPGYFGHNWDAMVDCLGDWHGPGHGKQDIAVLIDGADPLLGAEFLGDLVWTLCAGAWRANFMVDADGEPHSYGSPFALHFVFLLDRVAPADFAEDAVKRNVKASRTGARTPSSSVSSRAAASS
ncbi:barstar family protein [Streptomyces sp. MS1.HAVA.3]|uniref:Barstar family protein n=1 Tax=Streptomyces caledonius TaxID=3134107 RepID=A0ABU8TY50_9ACTN